ncbi:mitochondrial import receptor subunit TOM40B isoform X3 [Myotis daubentonii]|uniref:mitochondrial import receptor subunit TOM40B isoform X3 n=1 Tax=Myotis daubentonii TaxID=98922 RepID=UPI00287331F4|nr:mitochondrial import receptor subunit TOM40B isoform X3 [Myotis daubentonii]
MGNTLGLAPLAALPRRSPRREEPLPNPGSFDELHRLCKDVFPGQMEGVKLVVNKVLSSHFQVAHTVHLSALGLPGYHLHAAYAGDWQLSPTEVFPTVVGDWDSSGSLNAQVLLLLAERLRAKAVFQTQQSKFLTWQFDGEYRGDDYTATLTLGNPDLIGESEPHTPAGVGRRASVSPAARRGGGHLDPGGEVLRCALGSYVECGIRWGPCQLLPQGKRAGSGWCGVRGKHQATRHNLLLWLPPDSAAGQHGV